MADRAPHFRFYACDSFGYSLNDNGAKIIFGLEEGPGQTVEQAGVFLTLKSLKLLGALISESIQHYEKTTGEVIPFDPTKIEGLRAALEKSATEQRPSDEEKE